MSADFLQVAAACRVKPLEKQVVEDVAAYIKRVEARRPPAANARTGALYQPGIGPHTETAAVALIADLATPLA